MLATELQPVVAVWPTVAHTLHVPRTQTEYHKTVALLDSLIDEVGEDEGHPLASLMEILGMLIEKYEDEYVPEITAVAA